MSLKDKHLTSLLWRKEKQVWQVPCSIWRKTSSCKTGLSAWLRHLRRKFADPPVVLLGCGNKPSVINHVNVVITTSSNSIILPPRQFFTLGRGKWSEIPGYNSFSPEIILSFISGSHSVHAGEHLRLWYGEDYLNWTEGDNDGRVCCDVYVLYVEHSC